MRRDHRRLYRQFLSQWTIYSFVVDYLAQATQPTLADLVRELDNRAQFGEREMVVRADQHTPRWPALRALC